MKRYSEGGLNATSSERRAKRLRQNAPVFSTTPSSWLGKSILSVDQFDRDSLDMLCSVADEMKALVLAGGGDDRLKGKVLATLFYESSTRTCCSFQAAMQRLGGSVISVNEATSSVKKGETLQDTIRCLEAYCDAVAIRHPRKGACADAVGVAAKPILNAGDGVGEHPTQALLDLYTIVSELGSVEGKVITLLGDLKHGRTVHSLAKLLALFKCEIHYVSPSTLRMPQSVCEYVSGKGQVVKQEEHVNYNTLLEKTDVLYVTRVQKERFSDPDEYELVKNIYTVTPDTLSRCKGSMIMMHPLPRVGEISEECDDDPRAVYFKEMENGMLVRMALLSLLLGGGGQRGQLPGTAPSSK